uniref:No apical meristem-associated C-terminal domain-containing protein n=1 Tax=Brassica oleracea var. oleracea TaxID=109376 RepID=A0A0D3BP23_BRAOL
MKSRMISSRLSVSLLDDSAMNLSASRGVDPLEDRGTSHLSLSTAHLSQGPSSPLRNQKQDGLSKRRRFVKQDDYNEGSVILVCNTDSHMFFLSSFTWEMNFNPFTEPSNFVELLSSQQNVIFGNISDSVSQSSPQVPFTDDSNFCEDSQVGPKERRTWTPSDDVVLISSWLNTSKDPVVGNEQRSNAFWKRIADYFSASRKLAVYKFAGAYEAASRERTSGQNENDVLKVAHEIFFAYHKTKFSLELAWKELRNNQKWCALSTAKKEGSSKKRRCEDGSDSTSYKATEEDSALDDEGTRRTPGVKAAKKGSNERLSKKTVDDGKELAQFETMWSLKKQDLVVKERLSKMKLLDSLIAKKDSLADYEEALKKKLIHELMSN